MTLPTTRPTQPPPGPGASRTLIAALLCVGLLGTGLFVGVCGGVAYFLMPRARVVLDEVRVPNVDFTGDDWWMMGMLSQIYSASLDAVTADPKVVEALGEPVSTDVEANELYRRNRSGDFISTEETIEFDLVGAKQRGVVRVVSTGRPQRNQVLTVRKITVTLADGKVIEVPPPDEMRYQPQ